MSSESLRFSSSMPLIVYTRPAGTVQDWQELDRGPGYFAVPGSHEIRVRIKGIGDEDLLKLVDELRDVDALRFLDLAENRNITSAGLPRLRGLPQLTGLNLSSCTITNHGLESLHDLRNLEYLDLSYCNRLTDAALKILETMHSLVYVSLLGCLSITKGGLARVRRKSLEIYR